MLTPLPTKLGEAAAQVAADTTRVAHGNAVPAEQASAKSKATALKSKFYSLSTLGGLEVLLVHTHTHSLTHSHTHSLTHTRDAASRI
jgi:hypothetical protein